jgi:hypothetical protein
VAVASAGIQLTTNDVEIIQKFLSHSDPVHQLHYKVVSDCCFSVSNSISILFLSLAQIGHLQDADGAIS